MSDRSPVLLRGAMPAAMAPGRANGLYVVVVGEGEWLRIYGIRCIYGIYICGEPPTPTPVLVLVMV